MGDEEVGELEFLLQVFHQVDDLGLDGDVEGGNRLVGHDQLRPKGEGPGDANTLPLAAAELMRIAVVEVGVETDDSQEFLHALVLGLAAQQAKVFQRLRDDVAHRHAWIQRRIRILEDHLQLPPLLAQILATQLGQIDALEEDVSGGDRQQLGNQPAKRRLPAPRLADQADGLAGIDLKVDPLDRFHTGAQAGGEMLDDFLGSKQRRPVRHALHHR